MRGSPRPPIPPVSFPALLPSGPTPDGEGPSGIRFAILMPREGALISWHRILPPFPAARPPRRAVLCSPATSAPASRKPPPDLDSVVWYGVDNEVWRACDEA